MKRIDFYALSEDILPVLRDFESAIPVNYVPKGVFPSPDYPVYTQGAAIPNLGVAAGASATICKSFLVSKPVSGLNLRTISRNDGTTHFAIDQLENPDTIVFSPGGVWKSEILLHGHTDTISDLENALELMKRFNSAMKKTFVKIKAFYVGPQALEFLKSGHRLTMGEQSPKKFDLKID